MLTLLKLLKDGRFHSGQALGAALGISRSAVWKQLQRMEADMNLSIHKVRGRGYQLAMPLELLEHEQLAESPYPAFIHESLDSTNAEALRQIAGGCRRRLWSWLSSRVPAAVEEGESGSAPLPKIFTTAWCFELMVACVSLKG